MSATRRRPEAVFFDAGYTLVWFQPTVEEIVLVALARIGIDATVEQVRAAFRSVWRLEDQDAATRCFPATVAYDHEVQLWRDRELLRCFGVEDEAQRERYAAHTEEIYGTPGTLRLYDDALPVLDRLRDAGMRLGIISNWSWNLRRRVAQVGLQGYFEVVMASAYAGCQKPHPDIFHQALAAMGMSAQQAVHVGDLVATDVVGARAAGIQPILLDREGKAGDADCPVIKDLWGLLDCLEVAG